MISNANEKSVSIHLPSVVVWLAIAIAIVVAVAGVAIAEPVVSPVHVDPLLVGGVSVSVLPVEFVVDPVVVHVVESVNAVVASVLEMVVPVLDSVAVLLVGG